MRKIIFVVFLGVVQVGQAQQPEALPLPKAANPAIPQVLPAHPLPGQPSPFLLPPALPNPNTREVWQYYGVTSRGSFRPRVILAPAGSYYLYNGRPYPFTTVHPEAFMPYALD